MVPLLKGGAQTTLATQMPPLRLPGVRLLSNDRSALFTPGYCPAEPTLTSEDAHLRIPPALWMLQTLLRTTVTARPWGPDEDGVEAGRKPRLLLGAWRKPLLLSGTRKSLPGVGKAEARKPGDLHTATCSLCQKDSCPRRDWRFAQRTASPSPSAFLLQIPTEK